jgi:hypothetical protein
VNIGLITKLSFAQGLAKSEYDTADVIIYNKAAGGPSVFPIRKIIENSKQLFLVDSCIANLVEGMNFKNEKYFLLRSNKKETPIIKNDWIII